MNIQKLPGALALNLGCILESLRELCKKFSAQITPETNLIHISQEQDPDISIFQSAIGESSVQTRLKINGLKQSKCYK